MAFLAPYVIDNSGTNHVIANGVTSFSVILNTVLTLYKSDGVTVQVSQVIQQDTSWVYQNGSWHFAPGVLSGAGVGTYGPLQPIAQTFSTNAPQAFQAMTNYMSAYVRWAINHFPDTGEGTVRAAANQLSAYSTTLAQPPP